MFLGDNGSQERDEFSMPCDALIVRGSCVVNEAMLTGESLPQMKESIRVNNSLFTDGESAAIPLNISDKNNPLGSSNRRHIVYAGTNVIQHADTVNGESSSTSVKLAPMSIPKSPDKGFQCIVIRTGFGTIQVSPIYYQL